MKIQYICFTGCTGFATAAKNNINALTQRSHELCVTPLDLGFNKTINPSDFDRYSNLINKKDQIDFIKLYHCVPFMQRRFKTSGKKIGYATFETFDPPREWKAYFDQYEIIVTPSKFNYEIFKKQGYENLFYLPHVIDFTKFNAQTKPLSLKKTLPSFNFLWIGTWKRRKNYELLIRAFLEEFEKDEDVCLVLKTNQSAIKNHESILRKIKAEISWKKHFSQIEFDKAVISDDIMPNYIKSFDCFVSPTRGEGFGLPGLHAMSLGVPVITTNFSGVLDYANSETATLLEIDGFEKIPCMDGVVQFKNKTWPVIHIKELRDKMRFVYENYNFARKKSDYAKIYVQKYFGYDQIEKLENIIKEI